MSRPRLVSICLALIVGAAALSIALLVLSRRAIRIGEQSREIERLAAENRQLRSQSEQLAQETERLLQQLGERTAEAEPPAQIAGKARLPAATLEAVRTLGQLRETLATANSTADQLRNRVLDLQAEVEKAREQNRELVAREDDLREQLSGANRLVEAQQAELKAKNDRLKPLQTSYAALRDENQRNKERISSISAWAAELEDISRRREAYLNNILRRYRELTEQYRSLAARMESPGETPAPSGAEVARIQNAISMAEEDLRQLTDLNTQAARLQKRMKRIE